jgi:hypothetical protein
MSRIARAECKRALVCISAARGWIKAERSKFSCAPRCTSNILICAPTRIYYTRLKTCKTLMGHTINLARLEKRRKIFLCCSRI